MLLAALTSAALAAPTGLHVQLCWGADAVDAACPVLTVALDATGEASGVELVVRQGDVLRSLPAEGDGAWQISRGGRRLRLTWADGPAYDGERVAGGCFAGRMRDGATAGAFVACPVGDAAPERVATAR